MRARTARLALALVALAGLAGGARGEIIRLKSGVELHGELLHFDPEAGVTVKRYDNGGIVELRWEHILDQDVETLKIAHGYGEMEAEAILVKAKRLLLATGDYVIGVQVESSRPGVITLHRLGKDYPYLHSQVRDMETVDVEAQEVYTGAELYEQKVGEALPETALDHFKLAVFCESVAYFTRALEHYRIAGELDPAFKPEVVAMKIQQMEVKQAEKEATEHLAAVRNQLYKNQFEQALALCDEFVATYPESRQMGEAEKLKARTLAKRREHYQQKILTDFFSYADRVAYKIAVNREIELEDALSFAREDMGTEVKGLLAKAYGMMDEEVDDLWQSRKGGRSRSASYGTGTFILGDEAKVMPENAEEDEDDEEQAAPMTTDEKLKQKIEAIKKERAKQAGRRQSQVRMEDIGKSPEDWWKTASTDDRTQFIIAFFAERSGEVRVEKVQLQRCASCSGLGWFDYYSGGTDQETREPCPVCKTLGISRRVFFK